MKPSGPPSTHYRSPDFNPRLGILTDRQIERYILKGLYGEAARKRLLEQRVSSAPSSRPRKASTPGNPKRKAKPSVSDALRALGLEPQT